MRIITAGEMMELWRKFWRDGFAPQISTDGLEALRDALVSDDVRLIQGATTSPPPLQCVHDWPCEASDALSFGPWQTEGLDTVCQVEEVYARLCFDCDQIIGEPAACRFFFNWYDEVSRDEMRRELLAEVMLNLEQRQLKGEAV